VRGLQQHGGRDRNLGGTKKRERQAARGVEGLLSGGMKELLSFGREDMRVGILTSHVNRRGVAFKGGA